MSEAQAGLLSNKRPVQREVLRQVESGSADPPIPAEPRPAGPPVSVTGPVRSAGLPSGPEHFDMVA